MKDGVAISSEAGDVGLTVRGESSIGLGFSEDEMATLRVRKTEDGVSVIANSAVHVTTVEYLSDARIKEEIAPVNNLDILQRMNQVDLHEYDYTEEWAAYRELDKPGGSKTRARGVIAQELEKVFPEHVDTIATDPAGLGLTEFKQVDKQSLVVDLVGALQAVGGGELRPPKSRCARLQPP